MPRPKKEKMASVDEEDIEEEEEEEVSVLADPKQLSAYDRKQITATARIGQFQVIELQGGRTVMLNKKGQVVSPVSTTVMEKSELVRTMRDFNMKDPEQKPYNKGLSDAHLANAPYGTVFDESVGQLAKPIVVDEELRGKGSKS